MSGPRWLVTGASGFLGEAVVRQLDRPFTALLRGADYEHRAERLAEWSGQPVRALQGDVVDPMWGLSAADLADLRETIDVVVNLAAVVSWSAPWHDLSRTNIDGAVHGVTVAAALGVPFVHASTLYAAYADEGVVPQALVIEHGELTKYERTKCRAEWGIADAADLTGISAAILRIGALGGDVGRVNRRRTRSRVPFTRMVTGERWRVIPYAAGARLDVAPRDLVAARLIEHADDVARSDASTAVLVRNIGLGKSAPLVGALLRECINSALPAGSPLPRPIVVPAPVLRRLSSAADRVGDGPSASAVIGLRYFASAATYASEGLGEISLTSLVRSLVGTTAGDHVEAPAYYAGWPS